MNHQSRRPTIKQVAAVAGVSTQTVSRVMNGRPDVSDETRLRVQQVINDLGYQPSALARSLIQQKTYTLGVVIAGLKFVGPSRTLNGITSAAEDAGYTILLKELPYFHANQIVPIIDSLNARHVDGIIWAVPEIGENRNWVQDWALEVKTPVIYLTMEPREGISVVSVNNYLGGRMVMNHLLEQGYRKIGHISGPLDWWESRQRLSAWRDTLKEAGLAANEEYWVEGNWSTTSGLAAISKLFKQYPDMDAVFAGNDQMALSVLVYANQQGYRIPQDVGIAGFDNLPEGEFFVSPLTTVQQDFQHLGKVAVQEMLKAIESNRNHESIESRTIMLTPSLVIRESTKRPKEVVSGK